MPELSSIAVERTAKLAQLAVNLGANVAPGQRDPAGSWESGLGNPVRGGARRVRLPDALAPRTCITDKAS